MEESPADVEQFRQLLVRMAESGALGVMPLENEDKDALLAFAWSVIHALNLPLEEYKLDTFKKFAKHRGPLYNSRDSVPQAIWRFLTPPQRSGIVVVLTYARLLGDTDARGGLKRLREADTNDTDGMELQIAGVRARRRIIQETAFMFDDLIPELQDIATRHMALRPLLRFLRTDQYRYAMTEHYMRIIFYRDVVCNLDYTLHSEEERKGKQLLVAFVEQFARDKKNFINRGLTQAELEFLRSKAVDIYARPDAGSFITDRFRFQPELILKYLQVMVPEDLSPVGLYRACMERVATAMHLEYARIRKAAREELFDTQYWIGFSSPYGSLFDIRLRKVRYSKKDSAPFGFRQFRSLAIDPAVERLFAPLRDFYEAHGAIYPKVRPASESYEEDSDADPDDYDGLEDGMRIDATAERADKNAFTNTILNLLYGLSPLVTMRVEEQHEVGDVVVNYIALDTNADAYSPSLYAMRSTSVPLDTAPTSPSSTALALRSPFLSLFSRRQEDC